MQPLDGYSHPNEVDVVTDCHACKRTENMQCSDAFHVEPDPWELLREAMLAWNKQVNMSTFHDDFLDDWKVCIAEWRRINAALKQHYTERKSDA